MVTFHDFALERHRKLIYDGNASADYEMISVRLIMKKISELSKFSSPYRQIACSNMCTQENIAQFLLKRVRTIGRLNRSKFLVK